MGKEPTATSATDAGGVRSSEQAVSRAVKSSVRGSAKEIQLDGRAGRAGEATPFRPGAELGVGGMGVRALPVDELLPKNVRVPAVLGELAQHVEIHPAQWYRAPPVPGQDVVQIQG